MNNKENTFFYLKIHFILKITKITRSADLVHDIFEVEFLNAKNEERSLQ